VLELCAGKLACTVLRGPGPSNGAWLLGIVSLRHLLGWIVSSFRSREDLLLENLALRRQLLALHAQRPRTRLTALHKLFWVALKQALLVVTPETVVRWHRAGFRWYWKLISKVRRPIGRKPFGCRNWLCLALLPAQDSKGGPVSEKAQKPYRPG
jgi:hypothetical protein